MSSPSDRPSDPQDEEDWYHLSLPTYGEMKEWLVDGIYFNFRKLQQAGGKKRLHYFSDKLLKLALFP